MVNFKTRKRDGQAFPIKGKQARDSGSPSYVGRVNVSKFQREGYVWDKKGYWRKLSTSSEKPKSTDWIVDKQRRQFKRIVYDKNGKSKIEYVNLSSRHGMKIKMQMIDKERKEKKIIDKSAKADMQAQETWHRERTKVSDVHKSYIEEARKEGKTAEYIVERLKGMESEKDVLQYLKETDAKIKKSYDDMADDMAYAGTDKRPCMLCGGRMRFGDDGHLRCLDCEGP